MYKFPLRSFRTIRQFSIELKVSSLSYLILNWKVWYKNNVYLFFALAYLILGFLIKIWCCSTKKFVRVFKSTKWWLRPTLILMLRYKATPIYIDHYEQILLCVRNFRNYPIDSWYTYYQPKCYKSYNATFQQKKRERKENARIIEYDRLHRLWNLSPRSLTVNMC